MREAADSPRAATPLTVEGLHSGFRVRRVATPSALASLSATPRRVIPSESREFPAVEALRSDSRVGRVVAQSTRATLSATPMISSQPRECPVVEALRSDSRLRRITARSARATLPATPQRPQAAAPQQLELGAAVTISGERFTVAKRLGQGSFGLVWRATSDRGTTVAIKEILCKSRAELAMVVQEGRMLNRVAQELTAIGEAAFLERLPVLMASEANTVASSSSWQVRLVMSEVPGVALEDVLEDYAQTTKRAASLSAHECRLQIAEACRCSGELLVQLAPVCEAFSLKVYHRDLTPRNIQVEGIGTDCPKFGLVDFGLAVDAEKWRRREGSSDLGGDGRYWPSSAWLVFSRGVEALADHPALQKEYHTCGDVHALGLSAMRCFVQMLPNLDIATDLSHDDWLRKAAPRLREVTTAWNRVWANACHFWRPVFKAFRDGGAFEDLRAAYAEATVHRIVRSDIRALRRALEECRNVCRHMHSSSGLAGIPGLVDAILLLLQHANEAAPSAFTPQRRAAAPDVVPIGKSMSESGSVCRSTSTTSTSTTTMGSSPNSSPSAATDLISNPIPIQGSMTRCHLETVQTQ